MSKQFTNLIGIMLILALGACAKSPRVPVSDTAQIAAPGINWTDARTVTVQLTDFAFNPKKLELRAGEPIRLILVNNGSGEHNFSSPDFFAMASYRVGATPPKKGTLRVHEKVTAELDIVPRSPGKYDLECTEMMHSMFGMTGEIDVIGERQ